MMNEKIQGQVRHILTGVGPLLVMFGVTDEAGLAEFQNAAVAAAGSIATLVAMVWSWRSKTGG